MINMTAWDEREKELKELWEQNKCIIFCNKKCPVVECSMRYRCKS